jgi:hypothetical protein
MAQLLAAAVAAGTSAAALIWTAALLTALTIFM